MTRPTTITSLRARYTFLILVACSVLGLRCEAFQPLSLCAPATSATTSTTFLSSPLPQQEQQRRAAAHARSAARWWSNGWTRLHASSSDSDATEGDENQKKNYNKKNLSRNNNNSRPSNETVVVTREMLQRDMLGMSDDNKEEEKETSITANGNSSDDDKKDDETPLTAVVKRKNKKKQSSYRVLDNRDSLPFAIEHVTPDPYTHPQVKKANKSKVKKRVESVENSLASSLYTGGEGSDDNSKTLLGEFMLDKYTTTGDLVEIGDIQYRVTRHKCQYKYAGGKRFVMVRKILQVKEVGRVMQEEYLTRQWQQSSE